MSNIKVSKNGQKVSRPIPIPATLVLENNKIFNGIAIGARKTVVGEVCFNTSYAIDKRVFEFEMGWLLEAFECEFKDHLCNFAMLLWPIYIVKNYQISYLDATIGTAFSVRY